MVFPIGDDDSDIRTTAVVNYVLIALNVFVFVVLQGMGQSDFTYKYSTVPAEIASGQDKVTDDRIIMITTGGEPKSKTKLIMNLYGTRAERIQTASQIGWRRCRRCGGFAIGRP